MEVVGELQKVPAEDLIKPLGLWLNTRPDQLVPGTAVLFTWKCYRIGRLSVHLTGKLGPWAWLSWFLAWTVALSLALGVAFVVLRLDQ